MTLLARRSFSLDDQLRFAALTGDANPMHVDPLAARRTQFGEPVVHGVHGLIWALDAAAAANVDIAHFRGLTAQFAKPVLLGDVAEAHLTASGDDVRIELRVDGLACTLIRLTRGAGRMPAEWPATAAAFGQRSAARDISLEGLQGLEAALDYSAPTLAETFPSAAAALGLPALEGLAASTYIVGMEAPGLHSIYSKLTAALAPQPDRVRVDYRVAMADQRFRLVEVHMRAPGLVAKLNTFARVPPVAPAGAADLKTEVTAGEFAGQRALIIGGSRGLGATTAKLIAAGGGSVIITSARGAAEAAEVAADIRSIGGQCETLSYDATRAPGGQLDLRKLAPNAIYYFATGPIWRRKTQAFDAAVMRTFMQIHVEGFAALAEAARRELQGKLALFYPSSVYAAEPPRDLGEYAAAKRAGEAIAENLAAVLPETSVLVERLPAVSTDQNATVTAVSTVTPQAAMLPLVRRMQGLLAGAR